jgi:hypothetical protein
VISWVREMSVRKGRRSGIWAAVRMQGTHSMGSVGDGGRGGRQSSQLKHQDID